MVLLRPAQCLGLTPFRLVARARVRPGPGLQGELQDELQGDSGAGVALRMSPRLECWSLVTVAAMVLLSWRLLRIHLTNQHTLYLLVYVGVRCLGAVTSQVQLVLSTSTEIDQQYYFQCQT